MTTQKNARGSEDFDHKDPTDRVLAARMREDAAAKPAEPPTQVSPSREAE